ncbi:Nn.00g043970.m01.CDS01 [Neocucurbitaria sp. VM-36]
MTKTAVVVGGSLAGLMHGIMLRSNGYTVTILEQEASAHRQGLDAGIRVGPEFLQFMQKYDRIKRDYSLFAPRAQNLVKNGTVTFTVPFNAALTSWALVWSILHANFDGSESSAVPDPPPLLHDDGAEVRFWSGARVTGVQEIGGDSKVRVQFEDVVRNSTEWIICDLVVAADGSNSSIRRILAPEVKAEYAGYVTWRGTVPEDSVDREVLELLGANATVHRMNRSHFIVYIIPTDEGALTPGKRLINWVWYHELPANSPSLTETMTDIHGKLHQGTVPRSLIRPAVWAKQKTLGISKAPDCIVQLLERTQAPFVSKIYDVASPQAVFMGGKVVLVGDALVKFRPHCALSTNQAAFDCLALEEVVQGRVSMRQWERKVLVYGHRMLLWSRVLGNFQQGYKLALIWSIFEFVLVLIGLTIGLLPWGSKL